MRPGMIPILHLPGEMIPGQFGPINLARRVCRNSQSRTISSVGIPSVMQIINSISASAATMMASAADGGGTKSSEASAPVLSTASCTLLNTGQPSCVVPPLPGVTPPTIFVPYSAHPLAWNVPSRPVMPWTITRVDLSTRMLMKFSCIDVACYVLPRAPQTETLLATPYLKPHKNEDVASDVMTSYCRAAATTFSAASFMVSATMKFNPDCFNISLPCSTFVP